MRYNVHSPCALRNRIAKSIGVLVAAALVAVLGLPTAAQAQKGITYTDDAGFTANWSGHRLDIADQGGVDNWIVTFITPRSDNIVLNEFSPGYGTDGTDLGTAATSAIIFTERSHDAGLWSVWVDACFEELTDSSKSPKSLPV